jgi:hypothetical protein
MTNSLTTRPLLVFLAAYGLHEHPAQADTSPPTWTPARCEFHESICEVGNALWSADCKHFVLSKQIPTQVNDSCRKDGDCFRIEHALVVYDAETGKVVQTIDRACKSVVGREGGSASETCRADKVNPVLLAHRIVQRQRMWSPIWKTPEARDGRVLLEPVGEDLDAVEFSGRTLVLGGPTDRCFKLACWSANASIDPSGARVVTTLGGVLCDEHPLASCRLAGTGLNPPAFRVSSFRKSRQTTDSLPDEKAWQVASARVVLDQWLAAQESRNFKAYIALYAPEFRGTRRSGARTVQLDLTGWQADRQRMFARPMNVWMEDTQAKAVEGGVEVSFRQRWSSGRYTDVGTKRMRLVPKTDGRWLIVEEEQMTSKVEE